MTVREILKTWLVQNGYDGLYWDFQECGCLADDLMPCESCPDECQPGYKIPCECPDEEHGEWIIGPRRSE